MEVGVRKDEGSSVGSRDGLLVYGEGGDSSEEDNPSPRSEDSDLMWREKGKAIVRYAEEAGVHKVGQEDLCQVVDSVVQSKAVLSLNCQSREGHVEGWEKSLEVREEEVDFCIREEGNCASFLSGCLVKQNLGEVGVCLEPGISCNGLGNALVQHAPVSEEDQSQGGAQVVDSGGLEAVKAHLVSLVDFQGVVSPVRGAEVVVKEVHTLNNHIRFFSEESDISDFSDSIVDLEGVAHNKVKLKQRLKRKKKKLISPTKNQLDFANGVTKEGSSRRWKGDKRSTKEG